ncbi:MAG: NADP-dependent oxidoreductase [Acidimicrobiia bacterium]
MESTHGRVINRQVVLRTRPRNEVTEDCFDVVERPVPELGPGEALLEVKYVGIDPTIRGWLDERGNYLPGVALGEPIRSNGVGLVVATNDENKYPLGRAIMAMVGWQQYRVLEADEFLPITVLDEGVELLDTLNVLGHNGLTAYLGVTEVAKPEAGETFVVSAAAGAVGSIAGQIAKLRGARVIGIAGSPAKCAWVVDDLGFDACIDYKSEDVAARLKELAPRGIDVFFDNVGGELLDTVLRRLANRGRVVLCGDISSYDRAGPPPPLHNLKYLMGKRARMEGFNTLDHWDSYAAGAAQLAAWVADGSIKHREHVLEGIDRAPEGLVRLFSGDHLGKLVVKLD